MCVYLCMCVYVFQYKECYQNWQLKWWRSICTLQKGFTGYNIYIRIKNEQTVDKKTRDNFQVALYILLTLRTFVLDERINNLVTLL